MGPPSYVEHARSVPRPLGHVLRALLNGERKYSKRNSRRNMCLGSHQLQKETSHTSEAASHGAHALKIHASGRSLPHKSNSPPNIPCPEKGKNTPRIQGFNKKIDKHSHKIREEQNLGNGKCIWSVCGKCQNEIHIT